jgi:hypothetical protein
MKHSRQTTGTLTEQSAIDMHPFYLHRQRSS